MKRRTKENVGQWPQMRAETLKQISGELVRARQKHPQRGAHLYLIDNYTRDLRDALETHARGKGRSTAQIFASAATVAAMAIRIMEEGTEGFPYADGQHPGSAFKLEPTE